MLIWELVNCSMDGNCIFMKIEHQRERERGKRCGFRTTERFDSGNSEEEAKVYKD